MKRELGLMAATLAALLPLASAQASQTITFGTDLPEGTIANGFDGFNWHGAQNDVYFDTSSSGFDSAYITAFGRAKAFDLNSVDFLALSSDTPSPGDTEVITTVISGYLHGTLVQRLTEHYDFEGANFTGLNFDDVNKVTFKSTVTLTSDGVPGSITGPDLPMIQSLNVNKKATVASAPEMDTATGAAALTWLAGALFVIGGGASARPQRIVRRT
jgi:hypothetical protein